MTNLRVISAPPTRELRIHWLNDDILKMVRGKCSPCSVGNCIKWRGLESIFGSSNSKPTPFPPMWKNLQCRVETCWNGYDMAMRIRARKWWNTRFIFDLVWNKWNPDSFSYFCTFSMIRLVALTMFRHVQIYDQMHSKVTLTSSCHSCTSCLQELENTAQMAGIAGSETLVELCTKSWDVDSYCAIWVSRKFDSM